VRSPHLAGFTTSKMWPNLSEDPFNIWPKHSIFSQITPMILGSSKWLSWCIRSSLLFRKTPASNQPTGNCLKLPIPKTDGTASARTKPT